MQQHQPHRLWTYQDFEKSTDKEAFILDAIQDHKESPMVREALLADEYDRQLNHTIMHYVQTIFSLTGTPTEDFTASNAKICSNWFNRLNTQRVMYSLGNGVTFADGSDTKDKLGEHFDHDIKEAAYYSLIHGVSFAFWNLDRLYIFKLTEFVPLWDEFDGSLRAGIRFWQLEPDRPTSIVLYEEDGYTGYISEEGEHIQEVEKKRAYKQTVSFVPADDEMAVIGEENYSSLPVVPVWASRLKQSSLIGMQQSIDSYDLIRSGFANDLTDCSQIYWIVSNCGGMSDAELAQFRDRLKLNHIAVADTTQGGDVTPYSQEIPYAARAEYLNEIRSGIYEDFGGLDVHTVAAGATNDHIDAAYQPMDENADDFEYWIAEAIRQILSLQGIEDSPIFKRNRISNQKEQVDMVSTESVWLDEETILKKLPNIDPDEIEEILNKTEDEERARTSLFDEQQPEGINTPEGGENALERESEPSEGISFEAAREESEESEPEPEEEPETEPEEESEPEPEGENEPEDEEEERKRRNRR